MDGTQGGVRLRAWLEDERRTQKWLGNQVGAHQTIVSRWIRGEAKPSIDVAIALRRLTGISVEAWAEPIQESSRDVARRKAS